MFAFVKRNEGLLGTLASWRAGGGSELGSVLTLVLDHAGKAQANEQRYSKLKEKYSELVQNHADLLRKVGPAASLSPRMGPAPQGKEQLGPRGISGSHSPTSLQWVPTISWEPQLSGSLASHILSSTLDASPTCIIPHFYYFFNI